jgi:hypothetical protein
MGSMLAALQVWKLVANQTIKSAARIEVAESFFAFFKIVTANRTFCILDPYRL